MYKKAIIGTPEGSLYMAVKNNDLQAVQIAISKGLTPNVVYRGKSALECAISNNNLQMVQYLLDAGALVGPLYIHDIIMNGKDSHNMEVLEYLIERGADVNYPHCNMSRGCCSVGMTPLHIAAYYGCTEKARLLIKKGAIIDKPSECGQTALHIASYEGNVNIVQLLLENGANPQIIAENIGSPLHSAIYGRAIESVRILVNYGVDINSLDLEDGISPIDLAYKMYQQEIVEFLEQKGAHSNIYDASIFAKQVHENSKKWWQFWRKG